MSERDWVLLDEQSTHIAWCLVGRPRTVGIAVTLALRSIRSYATRKFSDKRAASTGHAG